MPGKIIDCSVYAQYGSFSMPAIANRQMMKMESHGERPAWDWDYVFVFAGADGDGDDAEDHQVDRIELLKRADETRARVLRMLRHASFSYAQFWVPAEKAVYVCFGLGEQALMAKAEAGGMELELKPRYGSGFTEFKRTRAECFKNDWHHARGEPYFVPSDRVLLILDVLRDEGISIQRLLHEERMMQAFAPHSPPDRKAVEQHAVYDRWWHPFHIPPLCEIKDYTGAEIALYFAYASYYTRMLCGLGFFSIATYVVQSHTKNATVIAWSRFLFGCALIFWSTYFLEYWQARRSMLNVEWGLEDFYEDTENEIRAEFQGPLTPGFYCKGGFVHLGDLCECTEVGDGADGGSAVLPSIDQSVTISEAVTMTTDEDKYIELDQVMTGFPSSDLPRFPLCDNKKLRHKIYGSAALTLFFAAVTGAATFIVLFLRVQIIDLFGGGAAAEYVPGIITAVFIYIADTYWTDVTTRLTQWENHRTDYLYQRSVVAKRFVFQFISNYLSLFYIAFVKPYRPSDPCMLGTEGVPDCMYELETWLISLVVTKCTVSQLIEVAYPLVMVALKRRKQRQALNELRENIAATGNTLSAKETPDAAKRFVDESKLEPYNSPIYDYGELVIQYGYLAMFGLPFPLAAFVNYINNMVEWRIDAFKVFSVSQRPNASNAADIGGWLPILKFLSLLAVVTNAALIVFTTDTLQHMLKVRYINDAIEFIIFEHILMAVKWFIGYVVNETPGETHRRLARQNYLKARYFNQGWKPYYNPYKEDEYRNDDDDECQSGKIEAVPSKT